MKLSIIIPVYNEAAHINELLFYLLEQTKKASDIEILVVDGGSSDNTIQSVQQNDTVILLHSKKGRGAQMNTGAKVAKGEILYFLHADSYPPFDFHKLIFSKINKGKKAGCFKMSFDSNHPWLRLAGWFTKFNVKFFRGGDQSLYVTKTLFNDIGGFNEKHSIFEDYTFIRELYKRNQFCVIQKSIRSSSRRYQENGITRLQFHYWNLYIRKWLGASTQELVSYYTKHIK